MEQKETESAACEDFRLGHVYFMGYVGIGAVRKDLLKLPIARRQVFVVRITTVLEGVVGREGWVASQDVSGCLLLIGLDRDCHIGGEDRFDSRLCAIDLLG